MATVEAVDEFGLGARLGRRLGAVAARNVTLNSEQLRRSEAMRTSPELPNHGRVAPRHKGVCGGDNC